MMPTNDHNESEEEERKEEEREEKQEEKLVSLMLTEKEYVFLDQLLFSMDENVKFDMKEIKTVREMSNMLLKQFSEKDIRNRGLNYESVIEASKAQMDTKIMLEYAFVKSIYAKTKRVADVIREVHGDGINYLFDLENDDEN